MIYGIGSIQDQVGIFVLAIATMYMAGDSNMHATIVFLFSSTAGTWVSLLIPTLYQGLSSILQRTNDSWSIRALKRRKMDAY